MATPAATTGIIHIEMLCTPAKSNAVVSIGIIVPPTAMEKPKSFVIWETNASH